MQNKEALFDSLIAGALSRGADRANVIETHELELDTSFRDLCAANACGVYGKCWMCPPDVGEIEDMMAEVKTYDYVLVYQKVAPLEDSYDFEGMQAARRAHYRLSQRMRDVFGDESPKKILYLGAGGCGVCKVCAKRTGEPCRAPELAMTSLEAYGINVSRMAAVSGMKYINGVNTVTYFGAVLFSL